jgi:serine/threonine protein kinase/WD40 repeat protein
VAGEQLTGRKLGDFVVRHRIGAGGYGEVYSAEQPALGRDAVIKVMHMHHRSSKTLIQRFLREARLASKLDHPYAAHVYSFGVEHDGLLWIAMEYVRGKTLHELLREHGPMSLAQLVPLLDHICEVLQAAHELGIVHRDIKPQNVMVVQRSGRVFPKLLDFGIAKASDDEVGAGDRSSAADVGANANPASPPGGVAFDATQVPQGTDQTISFVGVPGDARGAAASAPSPPADEPALTVDGAMLGSPPYMAPEQWADSSKATPRTDMYALGVLAFEALTGKRPFVATTMTAMAIEHTLSPVPSLGPGFPAALDGVVAKALAKQPDARHATPLEFAQEFRAAAGFGGQPLPTLDDDLRVAVETSFPQPIAEAVSAFHAAHNAHQARDALATIVTVTIRYVALIAIAAQTQVQAAESGAAATLATWLRELRRRPLSNEEWRDLARELVRPFVARPGVHPIPELVALLAAGLGRRLTTSSDNDALPTTSPRARGPDAHHEVRTMLPEVTRLLRAIRFVADYQLVVIEGERAESWMGLRRPQRIAVALHGRATEPGQPLLLDRENRPVLSLWPLVQVSSPTIGAAPELFLLEDRGRRGARLLALPQPLERQDERLWAWMVEHFTVGDGDTPTSDHNETAPFRGLSAFTSEDAGAFVGREREIDAAINRLRVAPLVAVVGPSGAGKSSFVHAGVVASLPDTWASITMRPGSAPLAALQSRLQRAGFAGADGLAAAVERDPGALAQLLRTSERTTVLVIDQFEELFTLGASSEQQQLYVRALLTAATDTEDRARILITLRDDFLSRAVQLPALRERLPTSLFFLATPDRAELVRILTEPLAKVAYEFEDRSLPEEMVDAVAATPGALPLLSFTAQKLWELRDRQFRQLTRRTYDALGGVAGALAQHAERTLAAMSPHEQKLARIALAHLVTAEGTRAVLSRHELYQLMDDPGAALVIEKLVTARLVTATESDTGDNRVELVHEALLGAWPRLEAWRREDAEGARMRDEVRAAARQWLQRDRPRGLLWRDDALVELKAWRSRHPQRLTEGDEAFIHASLAEAARGRRLRRGVVALMLMILAAAVGVLLWANRQTTAERNATQIQRDRLILARAQAELERDPTAAIAWLRTYPADGAEQAKALEIALDARARGVAMYVLPRASPSSSGRFSPDATRFAQPGSDGVRILDLANGQTRLFAVGPAETVAWARDGSRLLVDHPAGAQPIAVVWLQDGETTLLGHDVTGLLREDLFEVFNADGSVTVSTNDGHLVTYSSAGTTREPVWTPFVPDGHFARRGTRLAALHDGELSWWSPDEQIAHALERPSGVAFAAGATQLAFLGDSKIAATTTDGRLCVWDFARREPDVLEGDHAPIVGFVASRDGRIVISLTRDQSLRAWRTDLRESRALPTIGAISGAAVTPDGAWLVASLGDRSVVLVDTETGDHQRIGLHGVAITGVEVSPDGRWLQTESTDRTTRLWRLHDRLNVPFAAHQGAITSLAVAPNGTIISAGADGRAKLWSIDGRRRGLEGHTASVLGLAISNDGTTLATASADHTIRLWDLATGESKGSPLSTQAGLAQSVVMLSDQQGLIARYNSGEIRVWNLATGSSRLLVSRPDGPSIAIAPDAHHLAVVESDGVSVLSSEGRPERRLPGSRVTVVITRFSPDGRLLVAGGGGGELVLWELATGQMRVLAPRQGAVRDVAFSADGRWLAAASAAGDVGVYDLASDRARTLLGHVGSVERLAFVPGRSQLVTGGVDGTVRLWQVDNGALLSLLRVDGQVTGLVLDAARQFAAVGTATGLVYRWPLAAFEPYATGVQSFLDQITGVHFEGDSQLTSL